jgi:hypothetical protein
LGLKRVYLPFIINFPHYDPTIPFFHSGDFESGKFTGWKVGGALPSSIVSHPVRPTGGNPPNPGTYAARLGDLSYISCSRSANVPVGRASIQAYVNVPTGGTPHLRFSYRVLSYDSVQTWPASGQPEPWDRLEVQVTNASGTTTLARYGDRTPNKLLTDCILYDSNWVVTPDFDLSAYAGQIILLTFFNENHQDRFYNTWSYLDNIRIETP